MSVAIASKGGAESFILLVEDDPDVRDTVQEALEYEGYPVRCAADGIEALDLLRTGPLPAFVLLDLHLPRMSGREFTAAVRADAALARIPIVVVTSDTTRVPPGLPILPKPIRLEALLQAARNHYPTR